MNAINISPTSVSPTQPPIQSFVTFTNSQGEASRGTVLKLDSATLVFEVYNPYSIVQLSEVLAELTIRRGDDIAYKGRAVVTNLLNTGLMLIVSTNLIDQWSPTFQSRESIFQIREDAIQFVKQSAEMGKIIYGYRVAVGELRSFLSDLNRWLEELEIACSKSICERLGTYDGLLDFAAPILTKLVDLNTRFEKEASRVPEQDLSAHKMFAQKELHPLIMSAPYPHRTFSKPLGYAGDYEMMNMIHREYPEGQSLYARLVNASYTNLPIAKSVRNRAHLLERYLEEGVQRSIVARDDFRAISIGCGPAIEVQRFIRGNTLSVCAHIDLVDFNAETLEFARKKVSEAIDDSGNRPEIRFIHESVHRLLKSMTTGKSEYFKEKYNFVYCAGLFDYLSDKVCARLVRLFYTWLKDDGMLLVTNMRKGTGNRYILEHQAEWYLIYRDEEQMLSLLPGVEYKRTFTDDTGVNVCLEVRKNGREAVGKP